jgi:hypothetical protein
MKYQKINPKIGDVIAISEQMSLKFEKIADDLAPVWMEAPSEASTTQFDEGSYVNVTDDVWFVYDKQHWRIMTNSEHLEAKRQTYFNGVQI